MENSKKWYIIHTYSGYERKVAESLMNRIQAYDLGECIGQILIPTEDVVETKSGKNLFSVDAKHRITQLCFSADGTRLYLAKAKGQDKPKDGRWSEAGLVEIHEIS